MFSFVTASPVEVLLGLVYLLTGVGFYLGARFMDKKNLANLYRALLDPETFAFGVIRMRFILFVLSLTSLSVTADYLTDRNTDWITVWRIGLLGIVVVLSTSLYIHLLKKRREIPEDGNDGP